MVIEKMKERPDPLKLIGLRNKVRLVLYTDGGFEASTVERRLGYRIHLVDQTWQAEDKSKVNTIMWGSRRIRQRYHSSATPELVSLHYGIRKLWGPYRLTKSLWCGQDVDY
eukprot:GHVR01025404.1.p1 GENE.GHVR01025404.1~~GHVR01025404.1.p1  ORF type:complete len:111 (+),score=9.93 GHVR01025404.1:222-554(+)